MQIKVKLTLEGNQKYFGKLPDEVVEIPFEDYLKGVVAAEVGNVHIQACKAQAVAARTFAYYRAKNGKVIGDTGKAGQAFIAARMYNTAKYARCIQAVEETKGEVLAYRGEILGRHAHFSSSNNGTTKTKAVFKEANKPYLLATEDPWTQGEIMRRSVAGEKIRYGHGVGMSQYGAMFAASQGVGYKEILAFYYFGTDIVQIGGDAVTEDKVPVKKELTPTELLVQSMTDYVRSKVGGKYAHGARGPVNFDCSGLIKQLEQFLGLSLYHGATTLWLRGFQEGDPKLYGYWAASGTIDTLPPNASAILFNQDTKETRRLVMAHTGYYDGQTGNVVQAGGYYRDGHRGVWEAKLDVRRWSHWAIFKGTELERSDQTTMSIVLRRGSVGQAVREMQEALLAKGFDLGSWGADGKFGAKTETAVMAYQRLNGLTINGAWGDPERAKLNPQPEPPAPTPIEYTDDTVTLQLNRDMAQLLYDTLKGVL